MKFRMEYFRHSTVGNLMNAIEKFLTRKAQDNMLASSNVTVTYIGGNEGESAAMVGYWEV